MRNLSTILAAVTLLVMTGTGWAIDTSIPGSGLPSAANYSAKLLPELEGVVSWRTLGEVEVVKSDGKIVPRFSSQILSLDGKEVRMQGFMMPLDVGAEQRHFLISAVPSHCSFCLPAGPDSLVEVYSKKAVAFTIEPVLVSGKLKVLTGDPSGLLYRLSDAEPIPTPFTVR